MLPVPTHYLPCYMVNESMEIVDLSWMCGNGRSPHIEDTLADRRQAFIDQMAREYNEIYCQDQPMKLSKASAHVSAQVEQWRYPVDLYLEIVKKAVEIRSRNCI